MVTQSSQVATARKNRDIYMYLLQFIAVVSGGYKIDFNFNNILASSISSVKNFSANAIKISAAILQTVNLLRFSLFDQCDSDKPEKINISLFSGMAVTYLHK